jgi:uncharacterized protein YjiS (DUF1127 family)
MAQVHHAPLLAYLESQQTLPLVSAAALRVAVTAAKWKTRHRTRKHLAHLDDHLLRDVGLDRRSAEREARRMFWEG